MIFSFCILKWPRIKARFTFIAALCLLSCIGPHYYYVKRQGEKGVYHRIEPGQTLWRISKSYEIDLGTLSRVNRLEEAAEIKSGGYLFIPGVEKTLKIAPFTDNHLVVQPEAQIPAPGESARFHWPLQGKLSSAFGMRNGRRHEGIDISAPAGADISAAAAGMVTLSGWGPGDYGKTVMIAHDGGFVTLYSHNRQNTVSEGARVEAGQVIARVGRTGNASGYHLHFEIRRDGAPINPLLFLP